MDQPNDSIDCVSVAKRTAGELISLLKGAAEVHYQHEWEIEQQLSKGAFLMLISAALHQLATTEMAKEERRPVDIAAMFTGIKMFGMMFDYMVSFDQSDPVVVAALGSKLH